MEQPRQNKHLLYRHDKPNEEPRKDLFHLSPFTLVSTVSKGHPSLVSLLKKQNLPKWHIARLKKKILERGLN
jgi:hypothetical protein